MALARARRLPELIKENDLHGLLHCHTDFSDGGNTLEEMAEATRKRGYHYFGVADHSQSAGYAGGLSIDEVQEQHGLADELNATYQGKFRILKGVEADILQDGSLDYPDQVLGSFDFVVASVHSRFRLDAGLHDNSGPPDRPHAAAPTSATRSTSTRSSARAPSTGSLLKSMQTLTASIWTGDGAGRALELGCMFSINPDAHSIDELDLTRWGVLVARKGGIPPERVLNSLDLKEIIAFLDARRVSRTHDLRRRQSAGRTIR